MSYTQDPELLGGGAAQLPPLARTAPAARPGRRGAGGLVEMGGCKLHGFWE